ncbi:hypothetical protein Tco_1126862, partial [Tanacetum coccineum]
TMRVVFAATVGWTPFVDAALLLVVGEIGPYLDGAARCRACRHGRFAAMPDVSALCLTVFSNLMYPLWAMKTLLHFWLMDSRGSICVKNDGESVLKEVKNGLKMILYLSEKLNRIGDSVAMESACKSNGTGDAPMESATVHPNQEKSFVIFERF